MKNSVVNIQSISNNSFGTGFVIDSDKNGVYILTCQHVLDDVETPVVENILAEVIAKGEFIDMAVLYVSKLQLKALPLQTESSANLDVEVIGFSSFNKTLTQKKHIKATLYEKPIELHSKEDDTFYTVRKINANDGFNFDRGNSGSPVICKSSNTVIAMISNKEGSDIAYAIDIENLKKVWENYPDSNPEPKPTSLLKYLLSFLLILALGFGVYSIFSKHKEPKHLPAIQLQLERQAFNSLIDKRYKDARYTFEKLDYNYPKTKKFHEVSNLLRKYEKSMHKPIVQKMVITTIIRKYAWKAHKGSISKLKKQLHP